MLYEIKNVKQYKDESKRRWFDDSDIDLTVWFNDTNDIVGFQLCYDKQKDHHALTWQKGKGYQHNLVDDGENEDREGGFKGTPILLMDGEFDKNRIAAIFAEKSGNIPKYISKFVYEKLVSYPQ